MEDPKTNEQQGLINVLSSTVSECLHTSNFLAIETA